MAHLRDLQRSHKAQPINASLKPHEDLRKTLFDQEPDPRPQGNDVGTPGGQTADRAPDEVQAAPVSVTEREPSQTVGMALVNSAADAAPNTSSPATEGKDTVIIRPLDALSVMMVMVVVALGLIKFLFRRTYARRVLAFGARRLSQPTPDYLRPVELPWSQRNQIEPDHGSASSLEAVKKTLDTIEATVAEMTFSRKAAQIATDGPASAAGVKHVAILNGPREKIREVPVG